MYQVKNNDGTAINVDIVDGLPVLIDDASSIDIQHVEGATYSIIHKGKSYLVLLDNVDAEEKQITFIYENARHTMTIVEPIDLLLSKLGINIAAQHKIAHIKAPMPGLISKILVEEGQHIKKGDPVLILEAMKMENVFKAPADAHIKAIKVSEGTAVEKGAVLIELA